MGAPRDWERNVRWWNRLVAFGGGVLLFLGVYAAIAALSTLLDGWWL